MGAFMKGHGGTFRINNEPLIPFRKWFFLPSLPARLECYRELIEAFEGDMPDSLPAYRDWCEEHDWTERLQSLDRIWKSHIAKNG